jgi:hypothetical protein
VNSVCDIAIGALGRINTVYATATGWMMHMLSHLIEYSRWYAGDPDAEWVMAQAAGRGKFGDVHPSPDYIAGFVHYANGVHGVIECGAGAPDVPEADAWWRKCRIGAQGTDGFAEVLTGGGWRAVTKTGAMSGPGSMNYDLDMPPYIQEMADWLDGTRVHPCSSVQGLRDHDGLLPYGRRGWPDCAAARRRRRAGAAHRAVADRKHCSEWPAARGIPGVEAGRQTTGRVDVLTRMIRAVMAAVQTFLQDLRYAIRHGRHARRRPGGRADPCARHRRDDDVFSVAYGAAAALRSPILTGWRWCSRRK